jgi:threonine dehydratase
MFERGRSLVDGALVANLDAVAAAVRHLAQHNHIIAEGAGACPVACALSANLPGKIVTLISGGNLNPHHLAHILTTE